MLLLLTAKMFGTYRKATIHSITRILCENLSNIQPFKYRNNIYGTETWSSLYSQMPLYLTVFSLKLALNWPQK